MQGGYNKVKNLTPNVSKLATAYTHDKTCYVVYIIQLVFGREIPSPKSVPKMAVSGKTWILSFVTPKRHILARNHVWHILHQNLWVILAVDERKNPQDTAE